MTDYNRYTVEPEDVPRRSRARRKKTDSRKKRKFLWLKIALLVVLLLAIIVLGMGAGAIFALSRNLPSLESMQKNPTAINTRIYDQHGVLIAELHGAENRTLVTSKQIPEVMKQATVAVEDQRFYEHHGVDFQSLFRAIVTDIRAGSNVQGASTITEQYVKNAYVGNERTYTRKIREAVLAWQLEDRWSKDKILTEYLNTIFYGDNAYGVEAAAETYFHKHIGQVTLAQAALLAALPKAPTQFNPVVDPQQAKARRDVVLDLMAQQGYITQADAQAAMARPVHVYKHPLGKDNGTAAYFTDYVTRILQRRYGSRQVFEGGLKVYTSIDLKWQKAAIGIIKSTTAAQSFGFKPSAALVAIDPKNGYIRTMVGGLDNKKQKFNLAWQARRQAGSAMKPFVLATGVEQGMDPASTYYDSTSPIVIPMGAYSPPWIVHGDGPSGPESVAAATTISDNVVFAQLSVDVGPANTARTAKRMGITSTLQEVPSITLGTSGVSPLEMADAYATLASGGIHHPPQAILKVVLPNGKVDWRPKTSGRRAIPAGVASVVTKCLESVASSGTGAPSGTYFPYPRAGKTGTTENGWDLWYCGYTTQLAAAVWMGDATKNSPMGSQYGGTVCAPMWAKFFAIALGGANHPGFPTYPWTFGTWKGKMQQASPSPSASGSPSPSPSTTKTIKPTVKPTPKPTPTTPKPTPTTSKPKPTVTPTVTPTGKKAAAATAATRTVASSTGDGTTGLAGALGSWLAGIFRL